MLFCGIDLHSNSSFIVVLDDTDKVLYSRRLPNNLGEICTVLSPYKAKLSGVVVESTYNWYWLVDGLMDAGYIVHLANTTAIKQYDGLKHRGDESDARHLAHILRLGLLLEGHIMPKPERAIRDLARNGGDPSASRSCQFLIPGGSFLRTSSLDELPQLWSIIVGQMSFVGPRPALFNQEDLIALRSQYGVDTVLPGLTGWAQINGRDELPIAEKVRLDADYVRRQSLGFDIKILTVAKVLGRDGISH